NHESPEKFFDGVEEAKARTTNQARQTLCVAHRRHDSVPRTANELAQWHDRIAANPQPVDNSRKRLDGLRSIATRIVQQDNAAVAALLFDPLQNHICAGPGPVLRINVLQNYEIV